MDEGFRRQTKVSFFRERLTLIIPGISEYGLISFNGDLFLPLVSLL